MRPTGSTTGPKGFLVLFACILVVVFGGTASAGAAEPAARLTVDSFAAPSSFSAADNARCISGLIDNSYNDEPCDSVRVVVTDAGSEESTGPTVVRDTVPVGVAVYSTQLFVSGSPRGGCEVVGRTVTCIYPGGVAPQGTVAPLGRPDPAGNGPEVNIELRVNVTVEPGAVSGTVNTASVAGAGLAGVSRTEGDAIDTAPPFGLSSVTASFPGLDGVPDTQAGAHPYEFTTRFDLNSVSRHGPLREEFPATSVQDVKDVLVNLPLGFLGATVGVPQCTFAQLASSTSCPAATKVGHIETGPLAQVGVAGPLFNMAPDAGVAAELGFEDTLKTPHVIDAGVVPTPAGYVVRATSPDVDQIDLTDVAVTLFGEPVARDGSGVTPVAMFTNPSDCTGEPSATNVFMDSWQTPGALNADGTPDVEGSGWASGSSPAPEVTGCDLLRFEPEAFSLQPDTSVADSPTGLGFDLKIPQSETPGTLATPPLKDATVTLPAGLSVDPSAASGLQSCSEVQIGWLGGSLSDFTASAPSCPEASRVGTVEVKTPLLESTLQGSVYLAAQNENPFHSLLAGYIVIDDPATGVVVKIPGELSPDPRTGQITARFDDNPQLPFSELKLRFFGGQRGVLATPEACGTYTTTSDLEPWSAPDSGPDATPSSSFQVSSGCVTGFNPAFAAGTTTNQAGAFSPFTVSLLRTDQDQNLGGVTVTTPPGLLGILRGVERCPEPQASQGTCGANSLVGHTSVTAGVGSDPYPVQGGQVFLTGPYKGAPFGLSIVVPAVAGPFNLGSVVVRAAIGIDPHTAQITVTSDPLPTMLQGIPLDIRGVNVTIDRSGFMFNPTDCEPLSVGGALTSTQGASVGVSSRFQAANCQGLPFKPVFSVSTRARTSKKQGASLTVKGSFPAGEANIHSVAVTLPKELPARLTTIQQACTAAVFAVNPASCPAASDIGVATASTPILSGPVTGPVYLVSHGGAAFPDVVAILQGEGVTVELTGSIDIKHNITSSTFATVPDAPINSFQLTLPEGPHSGLAAVVPAKAKGSLCGQSLAMPFTITGQNGAVIKQTPKISVTGCPRAKKKTTAKKHRKTKKK